MKKIDDFTKEELRQKLFEFSPEAEKEFRNADRSDKWLLALNLQKMDLDIGRGEEKVLAQYPPKAKKITLIEKIEKFVKGILETVIYNEALISYHLKACGSHKLYFPRQIPIAMPLKMTNSKKRPLIKIEYKIDRNEFMIGLPYVASAEMKRIRIIITFANGESTTLYGKDKQRGGRWKLQPKHPPVRIEFILQDIENHN